MRWVSIEKSERDKPLFEGRGYQLEKIVVAEVRVAVGVLNV